MATEKEVERLTAQERLAGWTPREADMINFMQDKMEDHVADEQKVFDEFKERQDAVDKRLEKLEANHGGIEGSVSAEKLDAHQLLKAKLKASIGRSKNKSEALKELISSAKEQAELLDKPGKVPMMVNLDYRVATAAAIGFGLAGAGIALGAVTIRERRNKVKPGGIPAIDAATKELTKLERKADLVEKQIERLEAHRPLHVVK